MQGLLSIVRGQELTGIIAGYALSILGLIGAYLSSHDMDKQAYKNHVYAEGKKRIRLNYFKWLFARYKAKERSEIFLIAFVHELITFALFAIVTALFIALLFIGENVIVFICPVVCMIYGGYTGTISNLIKNKGKEQKKKSPNTGDKK